MNWFRSHILQIKSQQMMVEVYSNLKRFTTTQQARTIARQIVQQYFEENPLRTNINPLYIDIMPLSLPSLDIILIDIWRDMNSFHRSRILGLYETHYYQQGIKNN